MSAGDRPRVVVRPAGGVKLEVPSLSLEGAVANRLLGTASDGSGGVEVQAFTPPAIFEAPDPELADVGKVLSVYDDGGTPRTRWDPAGGGAAPVPLFYAGRHTITGSGSYNVFFTANTPGVDGAAATASPPFTVPGGRSVTDVRIRLLSNNLTGFATFRVWINNGPTTIALTVPAGATGVITDLLDTEALADGDTMELVLEVNGGNTPGEVLDFAASVCLE